MAALMHDLEHLDQVEIPRYATLDTRRRGIPQRFVGAVIMLAVFGGLIVIGIVAQLAHRGHVGGRHLPARPAPMRRSMPPAAPASSYCTDSLPTCPARTGPG